MSECVGESDNHNFGTLAQPYCIIIILFFLLRNVKYCYAIHVLNYIIVNSVFNCHICYINLVQCKILLNYVMFMFIYRDCEMYCTLSIN